MSIKFDEKNRNFFLDTCNTSYIFHVVDNQYLQHVYWGRRVRDLGQNCLDRYFPPEAYASGFSKNEFSLDILPQEYPSYGSSDLRTPAYQVQLENGTTVSS
jgi:alpha-galactosidase